MPILSKSLHQRPRGQKLRTLAAVFALSFGLSPAQAVDQAKSKSNNRDQVEQPSDGEDSSMSQGRLQQEIMDFSDRYVTAIWQAIDTYVANEPDPAKRVAALAWKVRFGSASMTIAASGDPRQGLLDMATFISIGKWAVNRHWVPEVLGDKATSLSEVYAQMDREIWTLTAEVLTTRQLSALRSLISGWEEGNSQIYEVADVRLRNLEGVKLKEFDPENSAKGILKALRNLLSRVDTSLLYGERVMFYMERTPRILEQQTTLTLAQIGQSFPLTTLQPDLTRLNLIVEELPQKLQAGIDYNQGLVKELLPELRSSLESGERLGKSLEITAQAVRELSEKIDPTMDYRPYLQETNAALDHLNSAVTGLNQLLEKDPATGQSKVTELTSTIDHTTNNLVGKLFERALILLGVFFAGVIVILILARVLFSRRKPGN